MNTKFLGLIFVFLLSSQYVLGVAAQVYGLQKPCCKKRIVRRQTTCVIKEHFVRKLDATFEVIRTEIPDSFDMEDSTVDNYEMTNGVATGFRSFQKKSYSCSCLQNSVRIFVEISFLKILVSFVLNLVQDLLGGLLGSLGSSLAQLLGNVVNLLVRVLALDIIVQVTIRQRFIPGTKCVVESYKVSKLTNIQILGLELRPVAEILSPVLAPVLDILLGLILNGKVKEVFVREIQKLIITRRDIVC